MGVQSVRPEFAVAPIEVGVKLQEGVKLVVLVVVVVVVVVAVVVAAAVVVVLVVVAVVVFGNSSNTLSTHPRHSII